MSCFLNLQDSPLADLDSPEEIFPDDEHDPTKPLLEKIQRITENNRQVRASTSMDSIQSYESIKAEKHFQTPLSVRHYNRVAFTRLLRVGSGICCFFQEQTQ